MDNLISILFDTSKKSDILLISDDFKCDEPNEYIFNKKLIFNKFKKTSFLKILYVVVKKEKKSLNLNKYNLIFKTN